MRLVYFALLTALALPLAGCSQGDEEPGPPERPPMPAGVAVPAASPTAGGARSYAADGAAAGGAAATEAKTEDEKKVDALEAKLAKSPGDAKLEQQVAEAHYKAGYARMTDPDLPPMQKYRPALRHFRRTLELDPKHAKAAEAKQTIEDIYRQMDRPVPQD